MGYPRAKGRGKSKFVLLRHDMMESEAWLSLSPKARCVWLEIMHRYNGNNNGAISLSCREVSELCNFTKNTASNAFIELQEKGFIEATVKSSFTFKDKRATRWRVTHETYNGRPPTNEWRKWKP